MAWWGWILVATAFALGYAVRSWRAAGQQLDAILREHATSKRTNELAKENARLRENEVSLLEKKLSES